MLRPYFASFLCCAVAVVAIHADIQTALAVDGYVISDDGYDGAVVDGYDASIGDGYFAGACRPWQYGSPDLFYNFYTQGNCNQAGAQMYMAPHEVPPLVGHTYYTYQPLYPHEYLYKHDRRYHRYYDDGRGLNRTHVSWYYPPVRTTAKTMYGYLRIPR